MTGATRQDVLTCFWQNEKSPCMIKHGLWAPETCFNKCLHWDEGRKPSKSPPTWTISFREPSGGTWVPSSLCVASSPWRVCVFVRACGCVCACECECECECVCVSLCLCVCVFCVLCALCDLCVLCFVCSVWFVCLCVCVFACFGCVLCVVCCVLCFVCCVLCCVCAACARNVANWLPHMNKSWECRGAVARTWAHFQRRCWCVGRISGLLTRPTNWGCCPLLLRLARSAQCDILFAACCLSLECKHREPFPHMYELYEASAPSWGCWTLAKPHQRWVGLRVGLVVVQTGFSAGLGLV